jgi:hypothetical protein
MQVLENSIRDSMLGGEGEFLIFFGRNLGYAEGKWENGFWVSAGICF